VFVAQAGGTGGGSDYLYLPHFNNTPPPHGFLDIPLVLYIDLAKIIMNVFHNLAFDLWQSITIIYTKYWIHRLKEELRQQDDVLAGKLSFYQGCLPDEANQDGGMDGKCREIHFQNHGWQSLHIGWIQAREGQLSRKSLPYLTNVLTWEVGTQFKIVQAVTVFKYTMQKQESLNCWSFIFLKCSLQFKSKSKRDLHHQE
jgi:hypothetical protein